MAKTAATKAELEHRVRIWACASEGRPASQPVVWRLRDGYVASLDGHAGRIVRLATSKTYFLTADTNGECRVWHKSRNFCRRASVVLHAGGIADLSVDRLFVYSVGCGDRRIGVWLLPELTAVWFIPTELPQGSLASGNLFEDGPHPVQFPPLPLYSESIVMAAPADVAAGVAPEEAPQLCMPVTMHACSSAATTVPVRIDLVRRPLSRWAGWQGPQRVGAKTPRGWLFAAGALGAVKGEPNSGHGVLMEWNLGDGPRCQNAQVVHDSPVVTLVYGPYDNGPLITADSKGIFRVWECQLEKGLRLVQQLELPYLAGYQGEIAVSVEQPRALYVVAAGGRRLFIWQRL